jgi:hypothetical protein
LFAALVKKTAIKNKEVFQKSQIRTAAPLRKQIVDILYVAFNANENYPLQQLI